MFAEWRYEDVPRKVSGKSQISLTFGESANERKKNVWKTDGYTFCFMI